MILKKTIKIIGISIFFGLALSITFPRPSYAVTASEWDAGNIIDDAVFTDKGSMSVDQIQTFLNNKVGTGINGVPGQCDTNGTRQSEWGGGTRAQYGLSKGKPAPFTCLKDFYEVPKIEPGPGIPDNNYGGKPIPAGAESAAQLIWDASQRYDISPKVLLVKLGTESAGPLTSDDWPFLSQYTYAMGSHCPDSGPGGSANCDTDYAGFSIQIYSAAALLRGYLDNMMQPWWGCTESGIKVQCANNRQDGGNPGGGYKIPYATNYILWNIKESGCLGANIYMDNKATVALYTYTPYQPNSAALDNMYDDGDSCSAYGNRNFWRTYNDWFGSTYSTVYDGVDYSATFDVNFYLTKYPDVKSAYNANYHLTLQHFILNGMSEGRQAISNFDVISYKSRYPDLRAAFGNNLSAYYLHYIRYGKNEGRVATGDEFNGTSIFNGVNYSSVYNFDYYEKNNPDIKAAFGLDDSGALSHFINYGMAEGRQGNANFNANSYKNRYYDLRRLYENNMRAYAVHYILYGKSEGRIPTGDYIGGANTYSGIDYSAVYNFDYYEKNNPDIKAAFGLDDNRALSHFINYGMAEGRQGNADFNVNSYLTNYIDLRAAFGQNLRLYYLHYIHNGKAESRIAI